jgi:protein associated with RNAse G/E
MMWQSGNIVLWKETFADRIWHAHTAITVKDSPEETVLVYLPGSEGMAHAGWVDGKKEGTHPWEFTDKPWALKNYSWHTFRSLFVLEPQKYYTTVFYWNAENDQFLCYYVNFQTPFTRSHYVIETQDLELDLRINPDFSYKWKDLEEYKKGIQTGVILPEWIPGIESAKGEILEKLEKRHYPFDGSWLDWIPDPTWSAPKLPVTWDKM